MDPQALAQLDSLIAKLSYREGDFTLASGKKSSFYVDLKATTLHPEGAALIGKLAVAQLREAQVRVFGVGGLTLGADPIATAVSLAAFQEGLIWPAFIVRKEAKDHGTSKYIEGADSFPKGAELVVLEDVVTTGMSSQIAISRLKEAGFRPTVCLTVVDREQGGREKLEAEGVSFLALTTFGRVQAVYRRAGGS